jgi:hypothetical protein
VESRILEAYLELSGANKIRIEMKKYEALLIISSTYPLFTINHKGNYLKEMAY